jgi:hypothetical protein
MTRSGDWQFESGFDQQLNLFIERQNVSPGLVDPGRLLGVDDPGAFLRSVLLQEPGIE